MRTWWRGRKVLAIEKRQATHVEAGAEVPRNAGSIPAASTEMACDVSRKPFLFNILTRFNFFLLVVSIEYMSYLVSENRVSMSDQMV